jgi:hypothetical protein
MSSMLKIVVQSLSSPKNHRAYWWEKKSSQKSQNPEILTQQKPLIIKNQTLPNHLIASQLENYEKFCSKCYHHA